MKRSYSFPLWTVAATAASLLMIGCAGMRPIRRTIPGEDGKEIALLQMYNGPSRPLDQVALLVISHSGSRVWSIDNSGHFYQGIITSVKYAHLMKRLEILPGHHRIFVGYSDGLVRSTKLVPLDFSAEAGRTYRVDSLRPEHFVWIPYLVDITTGTPVPLHTAGREAFEKKIQDALSGGGLSSGRISVTYPDGTKSTITAPESAPVPEVVRPD